MGNQKAKTWFITGATRGLGFQIAKSAAAAGDNVIVSGRNIEALRAAYKEHGESVLALELDVCQHEQIERAVQHGVDHFGRIDVLVNNAGYGQLGIFEEVAESKVESQFRTNVFGLMEVTRVVLPHMRQQKAGHIINLSSIGGVYRLRKISKTSRTRLIFLLPRKRRPIPKISLDTWHGNEPW